MEGESGKEKNWCEWVVEEEVREYKKGEAWVVALEWTQLELPKES